MLRLSLLLAIRLPLSRRCRDSFDAIYGASAGAINATYFLTGQREGVDIYAEDIANRTFCDLSRLLGPSKSARATQTCLLLVWRDIRTAMRLPTRRRC